VVAWDCWEIGFLRVRVTAVQMNLKNVSCPCDRLCRLVVRVPGYRSGGTEFDSRALHGKKKKVVGLERGPLSVASTTEELTE
jgi:hypothetical protein